MFFGSGLARRFHRRELLCGLGRLGNENSILMRPHRALKAQNIPVAKPAPVARFLAVDSHPSLDWRVLEHKPRLLLKKAPIQLNFVKKRNPRGTLVKRYGDISSLSLSATSPAFVARRRRSRPGAPDQGQLSQLRNGENAAAAAASELSMCELLGFKWI
jgi:hypothetical protein